MTIAIRVDLEYRGHLQQEVCHIAVPQLPHGNASLALGIGGLFPLSQAPDAPSAAGAQVMLHGEQCWQHGDHGVLHGATH